MTKLLKAGHATSDPRLGRVPQFDPRSIDHPLTEALTSMQQREPRTKTWRLNITLNQGNTSACTGAARTHDYAASPRPMKLPNKQPLDFPFAHTIYKLAQRLDQWPGEEYEGSSCLGALKAGEQLGYHGAYKWAGVDPQTKAIDDVISALGYLGPVVVGTDWLSGMMNPRPSGLLEITGSNDGGHSYIFRRVIIREKYKRQILGKNEVIRRGIPLLGGTNSWGTNWGAHGDFFMWADDLESLLHGTHGGYMGEAAITTTAFSR